MDLMIDHGLPKTELRLRETVLCTRGNEVCIDYWGGQLCSDHGMDCFSEPCFIRSAVHESRTHAKFPPACFLLHVSSCKRYMSLRGSMATHRQVFLGNQLQTTQGTAIDEAWWAVVYSECFEREWRGSLATRNLLLVCTLPFLSLLTKTFTD